MHDRRAMCAAGAMVAVLSLGGCAWLDWEPAIFTNASSMQASGEECVVLTAALEKIAGDWRTNPGGRSLEIDANAISADRIDSDFDARLSGLLPPKGAGSIDVADCGTLLASVSDHIDFVTPRHGIPAGDRRSCWKSDGGWISRAGIDAGRTHAAVLYTDDVCGERSWLVRLAKDYRGIWIADAPDPVGRTAILPPQSG